MKLFGMGGLEIVLFVSLAIGIVCGYFSSKQAEKKGYSKGGFFCLGFFLGVIGLLVALLIPTSGNQEATTPAESILKYKELLDRGAITQEEFEMKKRELL